MLPNLFMVCIRGGRAQNVPKGDVKSSCLDESLDNQMQGGQRRHF